MKKNFKKQMLEEAMERIAYVRELQENLGVIQRFLGGGREYVNEGDLRSKLYERELDEWRGLFMWGLVCDESTRERVKAAAYERFLSDKMCVNHYLFNGENPHSWLTKDEEEFRKSVKELFKPRET